MTKKPIWKVLTCIVLLYSLLLGSTAHAENIAVSFDLEPLKITTVEIDPTQKIVTVDFNKVFFNASLKVAASDRHEELKAGIAFSKSEDNTFLDCEDSKNSETSSCVFLENDDTARIIGSKLVLTLVNKLNANFDEFGNYIPMFLVMNEGTLSDVNGDYIEAQKAAIPFDVQGPIATRTDMINNNRVINVFFHEPIFSTSLAKSKDADNKAAIQLARGYVDPTAASPVPDFKPLGAKDLVKIVNNRMEITVSTPLSGCLLFVKVNENAFADIVGNKIDWGEPYTNPATGVTRAIQSTFRVTNDCSAPTVTQYTTLSALKNTVTLYFNENVFSTITNPLTLNNAVRVAPYPRNYTGTTAWAPTAEDYKPLRSRDTVRFVGDQMRVTFVLPLNANKDGLWGYIQINTGVVRDSIGNANASVITQAIMTDTNGPEITGITVSTNNRNVVIRFDELVFTGPKFRTSALRSAFSWNGETPMNSKDNVVTMGNSVVITLFDPSTSYNSELYVDYEALVDDWGNDFADSEEIDSERFPDIQSYDTAYGILLDFDYTPPYVLYGYTEDGVQYHNVSHSKDGKILTVQFNELIFHPTMSKTRDAELKATIKFDGESLKPKDTVRIVKDTLVITLFQPVLYVGTYSLTINEGALKDVANNSF